MPKSQYRNDMDYDTMLDQLYEGQGDPTSLRRRARRFGNEVTDTAKDKLAKVLAMTDGVELPSMPSWPERAPRPRTYDDMLEDIYDGQGDPNAMGRRMRRYKNTATDAWQEKKDALADVLSQIPFIGAKIGIR